ncbi:MAG: hypothetical protein Q9222_000947 [Ikaeria aurantiellina]
MHEILTIVLLCQAIQSSVLAQPLPVFAVKNGGFQGDSRARELIKVLYNNAGNPIYVDSTLLLNVHDKSSTVEIDTLSGGIWTADNTRLWNTSLARTPQQSERAKSTVRFSAEQYIREFNLLPTPEKGSPFSFEFTGTSGTQLSKEEGLINSGSYKREDYQLDISANFHAKLSLPSKGDVPIIGGGGNYQFTFDNSNRLIDHHGVWRDVQGKGVEYPTIPQNASDAIFAQATKDLKISPPQEEPVVLVITLVVASMISPGNSAPNGSAPSLTKSNAAGLRNLLFDGILPFFFGGGGAGGVPWTNRFDYGDKPPLGK